MTDLSRTAAVKAKSLLFQLFGAVSAVLVWLECLTLMGRKRG